MAKTVLNCAHRPRSSFRYVFSKCSLLLICSGFFVFTTHVWAADKTVTFYSKDGETLCRFKVELAVTPEEQTNGLMYRKSLRPDAGMLFIFDGDEVRYFWMKNTFIPLDLVFIDSKLEVVGVYHYARPLDESTMTSGVPARHVLEINAGKADNCRISIGAKVKFKNISR